MTRHPELQRFVDDELERSPLLIDQVLHAALDASRIRRAGDSAQEALVAFDLQAALQSRRDLIVRAFTESLRSQVDAVPHEQLDGAASRPLALLDETAVQNDVEISHAVDAIASVAEYELRELGAYTSALVGDVHVAQHTNPFHPAVYARALWAAANVLPYAKGLPLRFMRHASMPLAQALRKAYSAACHRLDDAGVVPGRHRTIVLHAGTRTVAPGEDAAAAPVDLPQLRDTMPVPLDEPASPVAAPAATSLAELLRGASQRLPRTPPGADASVCAQVLDAQRNQLLGAASNRSERQLIELLARLIGTMLNGRGTEPAVKPVLVELYAPIMRVALHDSHMLEAYDHPTWRFVDRIAFIAALHPRSDDPLRAKLLRFVDALVESVSHEPAQDAALYRWGLERLSVLEHHLFEQRLLDATAQIATLRQQEGSDLFARRPVAETGTEALDVANLATVPAALLESNRHAVEPSEASLAWLAGHRPGQWVLVFLQHDWRVAQLLWHSDSGELWLYAEASDAPNLALRRRALQRLHQERLLHVMQPRSLVRKAADTVLRDMLKR